MLDQVSDHIKEAMKEKNKGRLEALRMLKSKLLENKTSKNPISEQDVAISYCKALRESLATYPEGGEQQKKISAEIDHLAPYLPSPLDEKAVSSLIQTIFASNPEADFGIAMKALAPQIKGRFDGKRASEMVKEALSR